FTNDPLTFVIYTLSLHDALPIFVAFVAMMVFMYPMNVLHIFNGGDKAVISKGNTNEKHVALTFNISWGDVKVKGKCYMLFVSVRSEEHTSELQSRFDLVCRLLLE